LEHLSASTSNLKETLSKQRDARWKGTVIRELAKCAIHFRAEISDADYEIYLEGLKGFSDGDRVAAGVRRAMQECRFMPKLRDILQWMPEPEHDNPKPDLILVREFDEPYSKTHKLHVYEYEQGYRQVRMVRL
jgi:hypothetical protein